MVGQAIVLLTALAALSQTGDAATQAPKAQVMSGPHVSRFAAGEGCVIFNDQAEFVAALNQASLLLKDVDDLALEGIEDFEESILPPATFDILDDSLCGVGPNLPDGYPFPYGLDDDNLCVQSNFEHNPVVPDPRGVDGLVSASAGYAGVVSDVVYANFPQDSYDLIFSSYWPLHAVGFNPLAVAGGAAVDLRIYDADNDLLAVADAPADPTAAGFFGIWCPDDIGRINVHDPTGGREGADNIQLYVSFEPVCGDGWCEPGECYCAEDCGPCEWMCGNGWVDPGEECDPPGSPCANGLTCGPNCICGVCGDGICTGEEQECNCPADCPGACPCTLYTNQADFETAMEESDLVLKGVEDFEESILPGGSGEGVDDPLCGGIPNLPDAFPFPNGLGQDNLCLQSNFVHGPSSPHPRGVNGLAVVSAEFLGAVSDAVVANYFVDSHDLIFTSDGSITGIGFNTLSFSGHFSVEIRIYDTNDDLLTMAESPARPSGVDFFGVRCPEGIGRTNVYDPNDGAEGGDNIQIWVSGVGCGACPTDVDGSGDTGASDLAVLLGSWGPCPPGDECECLDTDDDGAIGAADLAVLLGAWGPCP